MDEENKKYSLWILIIFGIIAVFVVMWGLFLDNGELTVIGGTPFTIDITSGPDKNCDQTECTVKLKSGLRTVAVYKLGYEPFQTEVEIKRWENTELKPELEFIPKIEKFQGELKELQTSDKFKITHDFKTAQQALLLNENGKEKVLSYFPRELEEPKMVVSNDETKIAIIENTSKEGSLYIVDKSAASRDKIFTTVGEIKGLKLSPDNKKLIVSVEKNNEVTNQIIYTNGESKELPFKDDLELFAWIDGANFIVASTQITVNAKDFAESTPLDGETTFGEYFEFITEATDDELDPKTLRETMYFYKYNIEDGNTKTLITLYEDTSMPKKLQLQEGKVIFEGEDGELYELLLKE